LCWQNEKIPPALGRFWKGRNDTHSVVEQERERFIIRQAPIREKTSGKKLIMIVKTPGSQMGSPAAAEGGGEAMGGGRGCSPPQDV